MGWNMVRLERDSPLGPAGTERHFYFVHSYVATDTDERDVVGTTTYGETFPSIVMREHIWGTQFHPEKSADNGLALIAAFVDYVGSKAARPTLAAAP
jgi:glutamine amidotransferase